ncbi:hypothetical protein [Pacificibacter marinus]|uniref:hypothetical protein n=1 Tax=Pacificibacter marinus TaxID=658057 RepID=UPI001C06D4D3|nr:hypothetical protein [Pacificibacter marinus]MBU2868309.1 hypothetical protein [Pacificibacter marinus]
MLLFAKQAKELIRKHPQIAFFVRTTQSDFTRYAGHVGFFKFIGFDLGKAPNEAHGSQNYSPVRTFSLPKLIKQAADEPVGKHLTKYSSELAEVLCQSRDGAIFDLYEYCFREIMRNAAEHSRGNELVVFGQHWPAKSISEIVVFDDGVGVSENLYENEYIECATNRDALKFAILPGISGVSRDDRMNQDDKWGNSGFGLYVTSRFCSEAGLFRIISGNSGLTLAKGVQTEHSWSHSGTWIHLRFRTDQAASQVERINEIIEEGKSEFSGILREFPIQPSAASKLLASHFEKSDFA